MQVKTFTGSTSQEVLAMVKAEMGPDAVILGNRTYRKNGEVFHEITAGLEREEQGASGSIASASGMPSGFSEWHRDWMKIKDQLFALMKPAIQLERLTPRQRIALEYLQREGVSDAVAVELYIRLLANPNSSVLECLSGMAPVKAFNAVNWPQHIQIMAGPFGSGKTTTGLRFALLLRRADQACRIAFINADCLRGNGRMILRHWAELSNLIYLEAPDSDAMARALKSTSHVDYVFVDTPGLSSGRTLEAWLGEMGLDTQDSATQITMAPFCDPLQTQEFLRRYKTCGPGGIVWTKLDEAASFGNIVNVANESCLPVSALSYGPELKESLEPATEPLVWRLIFKRQLPGPGPEATRNQVKSVTGRTV